MARNVLRTTLHCSLLLIAWAGDRSQLREEKERRWNTPPELTPEQVVKKSDTKSERPRSLSIPITTNINVNTGENAHSLGFQVGPEGLSYSQSNSFVRPLSHVNGSSVSQSQSLSFFAGSSAAGATAQAVGHRDPVYGNQGNVDTQAFGFSNAAAVSSYAESSVGYSSASSGAGSSGFSQGQALNIQFPGQNSRQPVWTNIRPNNNNNGYHASRLPKLNIDVKPHLGSNRGPIRLHVTSHETGWEERQPKIHIHKWRPSQTTQDIYER